MKKHMVIGLFIFTTIFCGNLVYGAVAQVPLFLTTGGKANILVILDNSNSMDEDATGAAVGSDSVKSKSEIARGVMRGLVTTYTGQLNMGLMAYQQTGVVAQYVHNAPYDLSFDSANYDPTYSGERDSLTKRYQMPNSSSLGDYVHFNINLPFYSSQNEGDAFCYSKTADFDNGSERVSSGPWDVYRCFRTKTGAADPDVNAIWEKPGQESAAGFSNLIGEYTFTPTDSDYAQHILDFGRFMSWSYVGPTWFANGSPGRGYLHTYIAPLDTTQAAKLNTKLGTSQFLTNKPTDSNYALQNAGLTPIEGTLLTAKDYFANSGWRAADEGYTAACYPLPESCGHDYVILVTDGLPSVDASGNKVSGASALTAAAAATAALATEGVKTYVVGFAMPLGTNPSALDTLAAAGGTTSALVAKDVASLKAALKSIFDAIKKETSTAAALAANSTRLNTTGNGATTYVYQAKFNSADWSGSLTAYPLDTDGSILSAAWSTDAAGVMPDYASRHIYTWNGTTGLAFTGTNFSSLSASQQTALVDVNHLNWVRGDTSLGSSYRSRTKLLGDIINSTPVYVGPLDFGYDSLPASDPGKSSYGVHVTATGTRAAMLYVSANDGMLHGFKLNSGGTSAVEEFAFIPQAVYPNLANLAAPGYTHKYFVDGTPVVGAAYIDDVWNASAGAAWRTVLVGTLGAGGKSIFALDVTDPEHFDAGDVMWEFTDADLGDTFGTPVIARMANGKWGVIFGNGYNSPSGQAYLYIVDAETGSLIKKIATNATTANGLSSPAVLVDAEKVVTTVYAGDLQGNVWKFDLSASSTKSWAIDDNGPGHGTDPIFTARYGSTQIQPITSPLEISAHPNGGYMIYFGTGKYFEENDNIVAVSPDVQSFYGIWDDLNSTVSVLDRSTLVQQTITQEQTNTVNSVTKEWRISTQRAASDFAWTATMNKTQGWFMDLVSPANGAEGERVTNIPILRHSRVIFTTLIPSQAPCSPGGTSWLMEIEGLTGNRLGYAAIDVNGDGIINSDDTIPVTDTYGTVTNTITSGRKFDAIATTPTVITAPDKEYKYSGNSSGAIEILAEKLGDTSALGRQSWRQIQ